MKKRRSEGDDLWEKVKKTAKPLSSNRAGKMSELISMNVRSEQIAAREEVPKRIVRPHHEEPRISILPSSKPKLLDEATRRKISKGRMEIDSRIDLHGMTQAQAHTRLFRFLERGYSSGKRTILVITGKGSGGEGVLKNMVPRWLDEPSFRKIITGYHEAAISHGGSGALYVRIRRKQAE